MQVSDACEDVLHVSTPDHKPRPMYIFPVDPGASYVGMAAEVAIGAVVGVAADATKLMRDVPRPMEQQKTQQTGNTPDKQQVPAS